MPRRLRGSLSQALVVPPGFMFPPQLAFVSRKTGIEEKKGRTGRRFVHRLTILLACFLLLGEAHGAYFIDLVSQEAGQRTVQPGESFDLDVVLRSDQSDVHDAANLLLIFSAPGLVLKSMNWSAPYITGGDDDASIPLALALPVAIVDETVAGAGLPARQADIYLSNALPPPATFASGTLVRLTLEVPENYRGLEEVVIHAEPESFSEGFNSSSINGTAPFRLKIVSPSQPALPLLRVERNGDDVLLSWPDIARDVEAEYSPHLNDGGDWRPLFPPPELIDGNFKATVASPEPPASGFYRLRRR